MTCCSKVPTQCPVPSDQTKRPLGIDPTRGIGTAYEGYVKVCFTTLSLSLLQVIFITTYKECFVIFFFYYVCSFYDGMFQVPKLGAVKRGWIRQFVVVCDFKLFLYDITAERSALPTVHVAQVLDMRDPEFAVSGVRESDVIHAAKKDVPCIFRVIILC